MIPYIPSYYALAYLAHADWDRAPDARTELDRMSKEMALCFRDYLYMASLGESRHSWSKIGKGFHKFNGESRDQIYGKCIKFACSVENMTILKALLDDDGWGENPGYGGPRWGKLVELAMRYGTMSDVLYVDAVVNAQHNGGTAFSKGEASDHMDIQFGISMQTLRNFLDFRRDTRDLLGGMTNYFQNYSLTTGRLVIDYNNRYHGGIQVNLLHPLKDKSYNPVRWGDEPLPKIVSNEEVAGCASCGTHHGVKKCSKCSWYLCESCQPDHNNQYHKQSQRCQGCLELASADELTTAKCGKPLHKDCLYQHSKKCLVCYGKYIDESSHGSNDTCVVCGYVIHDSMKNWHVYGGKQRCHKHCYHLYDSNDGPSGSDFKASKKEFDMHMVECIWCNKPIIQFGSTSLVCAGGKHEEGPVHTFCAISHEIECKSVGYVCDCSECTKNRKKVKSIMAKEAKHEQQEMEEGGEEDDD